jgi:hypothetical protein
VVCFQYRADAKRFHDGLQDRLKKFSLELEPNKTRLIEFGRYAAKWSKDKGRKLDTLYFLGFTHYCTRNSKGNFMVGRKTEKTRFKRSIKKINEAQQQIRHWSMKDQAEKINQILRGHYAYYGVAGNFQSLYKMYHRTERYWRRMLSSRCNKGKITWDKFQEIKALFPLLRPKLSVPYGKLKEYVML